MSIAVDPEPPLALPEGRTKADEEAGAEAEADTVMYCTEQELSDELPYPGSVADAVSEGIKPVPVGPTTTEDTTEPDTGKGGDDDWAGGSDTELGKLPAVGTLDGDPNDEGEAAPEDAGPDG